MNIKTAHHFTAPAGVAFTILADPQRTACWVVPEVGRRVDDERRLSVVPAELQVRWGPGGTGGWAGRVLVREAGDGGSVVFVELDGAGTAQQAQGVLADTVRRIQRELTGTVVAD
jgi:hypothetical protein